ncbi:prolipoprotein diacylglyceryl transferase [candidate division KSB1 bacterium]|nr:prolipoprotein diacylglyceryl transferase [candidate division KSB1 bacterium]
MHPVLFKFGSFELRSYGLMLAISFILGIYIAVRRAKARNIDGDRIMDLSVVVIIASIVGARLLYVLFHLEEFAGHWTDTFNPFQSSGQVGIAGLTMLGGVVLAVISALVYLRIKKLPMLRIADIVIPVFFLGEAITRVGCYLNGCCFGTPCEHGIFCVTFPPESAAGSIFQNVPLHPAQLYSSFYALAMFVVMMVLDRRRYYDGFLFYLFFVLYGIGRLIIDFFRYYESSMVVATISGTPISLNQVISLGFIIVGIGLLVWQGRKQKAVR